MNILKKLKQHAKRYSAFVQYSEDIQKFRKDHKEKSPIIISLCEILKGEKFVDSDTKVDSNYVSGFNDGIDTCIEEILDRGESEIRKQKLRW